MIKWEYWKALPSVQLFEAVALVLGIDPEPITTRGVSVLRFPDNEKRDQFESVLRLAIRATSEHGGIRLQGPLAIGMNPATAQVALAEVVRFLSDSSLVEPHPELKELAQSKQSCRQPRNDGLGTKERDSLLKIIYGMATGGYKFDPSKRNEVSSEVAGDCAMAGCPIDQDTVRKYLREASERFRQKSP